MAQVLAGKPASAPEAQGNEDPSPAEPVTEALPTTEEATAAQETRKRTTTASVRRRETTTGAMAFVMAGVAVAGALVLKKLAFGGRRTKGRLARGALDGEGDDCGALVEPLDVEPAPCPSVPESPLKLTGRTFVVMDNIDVAGSPTQCGCPAWPLDEAETNAKCVDALLGAGARCVGKACCDELAFGMEGENVHHRSKGPINPANPNLVPGGSSSGPAVAVASGLCDLALGTDTDGGVRAPAACCGIFGLRTTRGSVSSEGVTPLAKSFDSVGLFARDAALLRQAGQVLIGAAESDPLQPSKFLIAQDLIYACKPESYSQVLADVAQLSASRLLGSANVAQVKVENFLAKQVPELRELKVEGKAGQLSSLEASYVAGTRKLMLECADSLGAFYGRTGRGKMGKSSRAKVEAALEFQRRCQREGEGIEVELKAVETMGDTLNEALSRGKVLIVPSLGRLPIRRGAGREEAGDWESANYRVLMLASSAGLPQVSIPLGAVDIAGEGRVPVSIGLVGARGSDGLLLDACHALCKKVLPLAFQQASKRLKQRSSGEAGGAKGGLIDQDKLAAAGLKDQGNQAFREGRYYDAVQCYSQGIQVDDSMPVLYSNRAMALLKLGNFVDAEADCSTCLSLDPSNVKALLRRGTARAYLAQFQAALEDFEHVLVLEPNNVAAAQELERMKEAFSTPARE